MTTSRCPGCRARVRDTDAWCSLCHTRLRVAGPAGSVGSVGSVGPAGSVGQRAGGPPPVQDLVGGAVPPDELDRLVGSLRTASPRSGLQGPQQALLAAAGVAVVLVVLLTGMTIAGLLL